jgi:hypothetical protein
MKTAGDGLYISRDGTIDRYDVGQPYYYVLHVALIVYALSFVAFLVLIENATVPHTFHHANQHGVLYSERSASRYWFALLVGTMRLWIFLVVCTMLLYRKTYCTSRKTGRRYPCCSVTWSVVLVVLVALELAGLAVLGSYLSHCNGADSSQAENPCNDLRRCCANEVWTNPQNACPNTIACVVVLSLDQLGKNEDFLWLFATTVCFVAFDMLFLFMPLGLWLAPRDGGSGKQKESDDEDVLDPTLPTELEQEQPTRQRIFASARIRGSVGGTRKMYAVTKTK